MIYPDPKPEIRDIKVQGKKHIEPIDHCYDSKGNLVWTIDDEYVPELELLSKKPSFYWKFKQRVKRYHKPPPKEVLIRA